ncbi:hypothetical protein [Sagittula stellata]|uniref:Periplasmic protein-like n=1 Tax=Sagittula stellata (strain ATCC 700073 / DSM 11524 / E-37) TaxID=388399 RepID=A3K402_SAGS3|nr:hypothetical protein [Sagittula stellata]EBA08266.1 periplasmic protein-like [Sagittula stellata E-37]
MRSFFLLLATFLASSPAHAETLLDNDCLGNAYESCFVLIEGEITPGLTDRLRAMVDSQGVDGGVVYLNSPGGNLGEGLRLGRYIRELGWDTSIGSSDGIPRNDDGTPRFMGSAGPAPGRCESACAYAFMGGERRAYNDDDRLGLHQFYSSTEDVGSAVAQKFSGDLVAYMVEMGVDARIFTLAASQEASGMYHVPRQQAEEYDLMTRTGFDTMFLEPYKEGVVAASRRLDPPQPYDGVDQVSFYCRGGQAYALMHAAIHGFTGNDLGYPSVWIGAEQRELPQDALSVRIDGDEAYLLLRLPPETARALAAAPGYTVWASYGRVIGGIYSASRNTTALERQMLALAFRLCID